MSGGFVFDPEARRLHHQPCGKSVAVGEDSDAAVEHWRSVHVCEGERWEGCARLDYGWASGRYVRGDTRPATE